MQEGRIASVSVLLSASVLWGLFAFLVAPDFWPGVPPSGLFHKVGSVVSVLVLGASLWYDLVLAAETHRHGPRRG